LLLTVDPHLLDDVLRLAAAVDVEMVVERDIAAARRGWSRAPLVIVGADLAEAMGAASPPLRDDVVVVTRDLDDADVWRRAVAVGARRVVVLPDGERWLADALADAAEGSGRGAAVVAVVGGRGGAGASTLAAALAVTGTRLGRRTMIVDADPLGGGVDLLLGGESAAGPRWPQLAGTSGRVGADSLHAALPRIGELSVLSWDRSGALTIPAPAMQALLSAGVRGSDLVVVDLPRRLDDAARCALDVAAVVLMVVPAEVRAAAAAARVAADVALSCSDLRVVVRGPAPSGLDGPAVAGALGLPLAGWLRPEPGLARALERGEPPARRGTGPLATFALEFLTRLGPAGEAAA
jgi:secretion/DNA translocation related CpaE-like protein